MKRPESSATLPKVPSLSRFFRTKGSVGRFGRAVLVVTALAICPVTSAFAQAPSDKAAAAEALFQEGRALVAKKDYAAACPKFKASHELDPGYGVLYNLAECYSNLGKTASAWAAYEEAAGMAQKAGQTDRVEKAKKYAEELLPKLEKMTVTVTERPAGLVVKRDGIPLAAATWGAALPVDPGKHTLVAEAPGKKPYSTEASTEGPGTTVTITIPALEEGPTSASTGTGPEQGPPDDGGRGTRRLIGIIAGGAGVAALAAGAAMGGIAMTNWNDAQNNHCRTESLCDETGVALARDAKTFAQVSTPLFIAGGVLAAGGATLFLISLGDGKKATTGLTIVPGAGPSGGGMIIKGRF